MSGIDSLDNFYEIASLVIRCLYKNVIDVLISGAMSLGVAVATGAVHVFGRDFRLDLVVAAKVNASITSGSHDYGVWAADRLLL